MLANRIPSTAMPRIKSSETMRSPGPTGWSGVAPGGAGMGCPAVSVFAFMALPRARPYAASPIGNKAVVAGSLERAAGRVSGRARGVAARLKLGDPPRANHEPLSAGQFRPPAEPAPETLRVAGNRERTELDAPGAAGGSPGGRRGARSHDRRRTRAGGVSGDDRCRAR